MARDVTPVLEGGYFAVTNLRGVGAACCGSAEACPADGALPRAGVTPATGTQYKKEGYNSTFLRARLPRTPPLPVAHQLGFTSPL